MTATADHPAPARARRGGPPPLAPGLAWAVLTVAAAVLYPGVRPGAGADTTLEVLQSSSTGTLAGMLLAASALPLLVWTAAVHHRLTTTLGIRVAGPTIGLVGGLLAAGALAVSGLAGWTAATAATAATAGPATAGDATVVQAFAHLGFAAGGPLFAAGFGLLLAGVAVPAGILRLVPRGVAVAGLVLGVLGALSLLVLVVPVLAPVLPVVRFGGLLWLVAVSVLLPPTRARQASSSGDRS